jgi:hypothetical protein
VRRPSLLVIVYLVIGVIVAFVRDYFDSVEGVKAIASAALAIVLWPLVLFGVNLHLGKRDGDKELLLLAGYTWSWLKCVFSPRHVRSDSIEG